MRDRVLSRCSPGAVLAATLDAYADAAATMPGRTGAGSAAAEGEAPPIGDAPGEGAAGAGGTAAGPGGAAAAGPGEVASVESGGSVDGAGPSPAAASIVVCLNRTVALRAIPRLPAAALEEALVVTGPPTRQAPDPAPAAGRWREFDPAGAYRDRMAELTTQAGTSMGGRLRALSSAGARHRERDAMAADKEAWIADAGRRALEAIRDEASGRDGTPPQVVAVEAADVAAALPLLDAGVLLAPGGLRWLADRSEARRRT
jgi:hypothetical protein